MQGRQSRRLLGAQRQHAVRRDLGRGENAREEDDAGDIEEAAKGKKANPVSTVFRYYIFVKNWAYVYDSVTHLVSRKVSLQTLVAVPF